MAQFGIDVANVKGSIPTNLKLSGISTLRPLILNKGLTIVNKMAPPLLKEVASSFIDDLCPSASKLQQIIEKRNNIVDQANQIATFLTGILEALTLASTILGTLLTVLNVVKIAKTIIQVVAGFIPLSPGGIPAGIGLIGDALDEVTFDKDGNPRIPPIKAKIDGLLIPIAIVLAGISALIAALSALDSAVAACVIPTTGPGEGNGGGAGGSFGEVLRGPVLKFKIESEGQNYKNGTYEDVKLKGGDGNGVRANIRVKKNKVVKAEVYRDPETGELKGGDGYSTQLFDPTKGFTAPNFLYVKKGKFGKAKLDVKELLESIDLKKRILRKIKKKKVKGDGMLLSVAEIGASQDSGGNNTGNLEVGLDSQGRIRPNAQLQGATPPPSIGLDPSTVGTSTDLIGIGIGAGITDGVITEVLITNQGFNCVDGIYPTQIVKEGTGEQALLEITISNGSIKGTKINNGGLNYTQGDIVNVDICPNASLLVNQVDSTLTNPETQITDTSTGLVTSEPESVAQFNDKNAKLLAVLAGGPLQVPDGDGNPILNDDGTPLTLPGLNALDPTLLTLAAGAQQAAITDNDSSYKGFNLEIEEREFSLNLDQRRAVAINPSGIIEAATEFSFATDEGVLIEDVKLIIDEQDLRADFSGQFNFGEQITSIESQVDLPILVGENTSAVSNPNILANIGGNTTGGGGSGGNSGGGGGGY